jgi:hypothetical protein
LVVAFQRLFGYGQGAKFGQGASVGDFIGIDLGCCRSLKATAIDAELRLRASASVHFDSELPRYGTKDGVHRDPHGEMASCFQGNEFMCSDVLE